MAGKVLILRWAHSAYDSLGSLLELTAREFVACGLEVTVFTADDTDWPSRLIQVIGRGDISFALTMSGIGTDLAVDDRLVWETAKVPLFNWNCDHPCYFPARHAVRNAYLLHGYVFPDHARYHIRHLNSNGAAFAVHLGIPPRDLFPAAPLPPRQRNGRIMFAKSGHDTNAIEAGWRTYDADLQHIVFTAAEELFPRSTDDFLPVLQRTAETRGLFLAGNSRLTMLLMQEIDYYIRFKRANLVMRTVLRYPVDVFGSGWDHIGWDAAAAKYHGAITWPTMIEKLPCYVGCLSINPLVEDSVHDRVFFALAAGVTPISDDNHFARTYMPRLTSMRFSFAPDQIEQAVEAVLADPAYAITRSQDAWHALATPFGLRRSALQIGQFAMLHALNTAYT